MTLNELSKEMAVSLITNPWFIGIFVVLAIITFIYVFLKKHINKKRR